MLRLCNKEACQLQLLSSSTPVPRALDAALCDSVLARDRLPCAPPPISPGDCQLLGCCYSLQEEEAGSCYYGDTGERATCL